MSGKDVTRIDTIFSNPPAAHACTGVDHLWTEGAGFDHVPIRVRLRVEAFNDCISTICKPVQLALPDKPKHKSARLEQEKVNDDHFRRLWNKHYKEKPGLECFHSVIEYLSVNCLSSLGGNFVPFQWVINF